MPDLVETRPILGQIPQQGKNSRVAQHCASVLVGLNIQACPPLLCAEYPACAKEDFVWIARSACVMTHNGRNVSIPNEMCEVTINENKFGSTVFQDV